MPGALYFTCPVTGKTGQWLAMLDLRRSGIRHQERSCGMPVKIPNLKSQTKSFCVFFGQHESEPCDIMCLCLFYCVLHFLSFFNTFTKMNHPMIFNAFPVDVQGGNRKCRNRHVAETTAIHFQLAFQVRTCNMQLPGALSPRRRIHFPNPSSASKIIS